MTLLEAFATFIVEHGKHEGWCDIVTQATTCSCSYGELFDAAYKFLEHPVDDDFLRLARSVETIQDQMGRILDLIKSFREVDNDST